MKSIGFIIITYNRPAELLALLNNLTGLEQKETLLQEIIIVNNDSSESYNEAELFINQHKELPIRYIHSAENLGVAKGRNLALSYATAPILVMLDDDGELKNSNALMALDNLFNEKGESLAVASFKVNYFSTGAMQVNAFPHKQFHKRKDLHEFETYYFAGGAHAIRKTVMQELNGYPIEFFYGMEEYDLSYRIIDKGYSILYTDAVVMLHKESPAGRPPHRDKMKMLWKNKSVVAWRYLPGVYFWTTKWMWSFEYLRKTSFDLWGWLKGWREIRTIPHSQKRMPIGKDALLRLKNLDARLWY